MKRRQFLSLGAAAAAATAVSGLSCGRQSVRPNILWITCEDIGPALGCYGDEQAVTPHLDRLAQSGTLYKRAYATAPICAPARSCLITGMHATTLGTQHLRSEIPVPDSLETLPEVLREHGYFCTNNSKTDYNFDPSGMWDENSREAHWRHRLADQPFFSIFNLTVSHEGHANDYKKEDYTTLDERHDPETIDLPPYFPDTPDMRGLWARYYDLITVMDQHAGKILDQLREDGLEDNTIVFFFSDHGFGMPRYKRWLYSTGLQVPLIVRIPEALRGLEATAGSATDQLVSFVDFAPTVLSLAGLSVPELMQGLPFLGGDELTEREFVFAARSRADDVYDVSRAILSRRYIYIRNYMPHQAYIQDARIFSADRKGSYRELRRLRQRGELRGYAQTMFEPKPAEEFYDLESDPHELNNVVNEPEYRDVVLDLHTKLKRWILETRDTGFTPEPEMMRRAHGSTPYETAQHPKQYPLERILKTAEQVGMQADLAVLRRDLEYKYAGVRYWAVVACLAHPRGGDLLPELLQRLNDDNPSVQIAVAEAVCTYGDITPALPVLERHLNAKDHPTRVLQTAIVLRRIGEKACPLMPVVKKVMKRYEGDVWGRYKNWSYPMFIGMALDQMLINCGESVN